jgi:hypothetical protein
MLVLVMLDLCDQGKPSIKTSSEKDQKESLLPSQPLIFTSSMKEKQKEKVD